MSGSKSKIAITLLSTLACSAGASAKDFGVKNFDNSKQTGTVGRAASQAKKGMPLAAKVVAGTLGTLAGLEFIHSMIGGFTDSKLGSYSFGRLIRNRVKKTKQPGLGAQDNEKNIENVQNNDEKDENLNAVLEKFRNAAPSAFDSRKDGLINFYKKIINKEYSINNDCDEFCKEAANLIINFMDNPNAEDGLKIEYNNSYRFTFKGVKCFILFTLKNRVNGVQIVGASKTILNTI